MHLGVYSPLIFAGILGGLGWGIVRARRGGGEDRAKFLVSIALPLVGFYFLLSFKAAGEPNWTVPGIFTAILLTVPWALQKARESRVFAGFSVAALALGLLMSLAVINTDVVRAVGIPWSYEKDPSTRLRGWQTVAQEVEQTRQEFAEETGSDPFLIGNDYQMAAVLSFYLPDPQPRPSAEHPPVFQMATGQVQTQFSFWPDYLQPESSREFYTGRDALFITDEPGKSVPEEISRRFDRTRLISIFEVTRRGEVLRQIRIFALHDFLGSIPKKPEAEPEPATPAS
jgi:hypothetical protein